MKVTQKLVALTVVVGFLPGLVSTCTAVDLANPEASQSAAVSRLEACQIIGWNEIKSRHMQNVGGRVWPIQVPIWRKYSGRSLIVDLSTNRKGGYPITVTLSYRKNGSWQKVCESTVDHRLSTLQGKVLLGAIQDTSVDTALWQVDLSVATHGEKPKNSQRVFFDVYSDKPDASSSRSWNRDLYFCAEANPGSEGDVPTARDAFAKSPILFIALADERGIQDSLQDKLETPILSAVAAWTSICAGCVPGNNTVVVINDKLFINSDVQAVLTKLRTAQHRSLTPSEIDRVVKEGSKRTQGELRYEPFIPEEIEFWTDLCDKPRDSLPPMLAGLGYFACRGRKQHQETNMFFLRLVNHFTSCGDDPNILACSVNDVEVQLNTRDYSYVSSGEVVFGSGPNTVDLDRVIFHEIGHWVGLGHLNIPGSIMNPVYQETKCVDGATVEAMRKIQPSKVDKDVK